MSNKNYSGFSQLLRLAAYILSGYTFVNLFDLRYIPLPKQTGIIQQIDTTHDFGTILPDNSAQIIWFPTVFNRHSLTEFNARPGDKVKYRVYLNQALHIELYERWNIYENWMWCVRCYQYYTYSDAIKVSEDSNWGSYPAFHCPICRHRLIDGHSTPSFIQVYNKYKNNLLNDEESKAFGHALEDRKKLADLLKSWGYELP